MTQTVAHTHILLIHGSFARGADWIQEDAPLRRHLHEALGSTAATTSIAAFNWSGHNSFHARADATGRLQRLIRRILADDERARIYFVAHSHGANIALQAMADPQVAACVDGIVCLAAPVMHSTLVAASTHDGRAVRAWTLMATLVPIALLADRLAVDGWAGWSRRSPHTLLALVILAAVMAIALIATIVQRLDYQRRVMSYNRRAAARLDALLRPPTIDPARVVFVRHAGDEAGLTAGFLGLIGHLSDRAAAILEDRYRRIDRLLSATGGHRLTIAFATAGIALIVFFHFVRALPPRIVVFTALFLILSVPPLVSLVLRCVRAIGTMRTLFFGIATIPIGSFVRINIEATPAGEWNVVMLPRVKTPTHGDGVPIVDAHCRVNQLPEFLAFVSEWIAARVGANSRR